MNTDTRRLVMSRMRLLLICLIGLAVVGGCRTTGSSWTPVRTIPFSPDDRAIAYAHEGAMYVARTSGDEHHRVFESADGTVLSAPHWAPGQKGLIFAVSEAESTVGDQGIDYSVWYWPAPEDIWRSAGESRDDSVELPVNWRPEQPVKLFSARCSHEMQIRADALFAWHPGGGHVFYLDTDADGIQNVWSFDVNARESSAAAPVSARSVAFEVAPEGNRIQVAVADDAATALWVGPLGGSAEGWREIESAPGPAVVPRLEIPRDGTYLYDLRPRLGAWSPDAKWLAHTRLNDDPESGGFHLVITRLGADGSQQTVEVPRGSARDLQWRPDGQALGLLNDEKLMVVNPVTAEASTLAGVLGVERFVGWSDTGNYLAYLIYAESFPETTALLPTGERVEWAPAERHNIMVAAPDGASPQNRFGMMNITAAQWGNRTDKLSFWATYLPTVSLLPPGDPAAVLDLEDDHIHWYPTNVAEYAHVGHYYLLGGEFGTAIEQYGRALSQLSDSDREAFPELEWSLHLWRGMAHQALDDEYAADRDLSHVREHAAMPDPNADWDPDWDQDVLRSLIADRSILATMLSMGQVQLAIAEATRIAEEYPDARRIQALCFLALIHDSLSQRERYADNVVQELLPAVLASQEIPAEVSDLLFEEYLIAVTSPDRLRLLSSKGRGQVATVLAELAGSAPSHRANALVRAAAIVYREAGDIDAELALLRSN